MSSLALGPDVAPGGARARALEDLFARRGSEVLLGVAVMALAAIQLAALRNSFDVDSWLALVTGREVWQTGLPHHETLTAIAHGSVWIDQQWLSQLIIFALHRLGGLALVGVVNVTLIVVAVGGGVTAARRLGAHPLAIMVTLALCLFMVEPSRQVRTQELALPLFVLIAFLLATDSRSPSARVYWCLPALVAWANLHGSVLLGAGLVMLHGLCVGWERRERLTCSLRSWGRPLALGAGAPLCLLATPYGLTTITYYRTLLLGGTVRENVSEWQPITSAPLATAVFLALAGLALWSFGRDPSRTTRWDKLALLALAAGSVAAIRDLLFFGLLALVVLPVSLGSLPVARRPDGDRWARRRPQLNLLLSLAAVGAVSVAVLSTLRAPDARFQPAYGQRAGLLGAVERVTTADPSIRVLAEDRFADWLLWRDPGLAGRVASDSRFELLSPHQMTLLNRTFGVRGTDWRLGARGLRLVVLDRASVPDAVRAFRAEAGSRVLFDDGERVAILRSRWAAG